MPFKKGDFVLVDYIGRISETKEVFDTTLEEVARNSGIYREGGIYEPVLVVLGEGWLLKALEDSVMNLDIGKTETVEIPPEKAFGNRDAEKVKLYPLRKLTAKGVTPQVGMRVEVDGRLATVRTIGSGRVLLDFNPPLAGKTLIYEVTVRKLLEATEEKMLALIHRRIPQISIEKFSLEVSGDEVKINIPEEAFYLDGLQISKRGIFSDFQKFFPEIRTVTFIESFTRVEKAGGEPSSTQDQKGSASSP
ncbi:MAG: FKBP-type peptidyl-prolyl cis-trans isomerase [Nitrososphaerota archaeon]|nr:peptidylprolyl isomerase [Candidatus Bathyarchaeota archaeon]MDW8048671.1 FKBP-type peptidyl-prolyl cis-trans isomerase [Nitrososphaerota archaeon]